MEQKMLLPIVVLVLIGGFIIGYYAATFGGAGKSAGSSTAAPALTSGDVVSKTQYPEFFQAQTLTQFLKGQLVSAEGDSVVISQNSRSLAIKKPMATNYFISTATGRATVDATLLKAGETVTIALTFDAETGKAKSLAVSAAR